MAKRRLTGTIREDVHNHLTRNSGLGIKQKEALRALQVYMATCWYEWATSITDKVSEHLPESCLVPADNRDYIRCKNFYAGSGDYEYIGDLVGTLHLNRKIVEGLGADRYGPRQMTKIQIKETKLRGKAWDDSKESLKAFTNDLGSILSSNTTVEGLIDDLPQCAEFAKQFLNPKRDQQTSLVVPGAHKRIRAALRAAAKA